MAARPHAMVIATPMIGVTPIMPLVLSSLILNAQVAVNYIRGDQSLEGLNGLRQRDSGLLGPVVNGTPWIQSTPSSTLPGITADGYSTFFAAQKNRDKLLWVAANDGMLHAFNPTTGAEVFAYVPGPLANRLAEIPLQRGTTARTKINPHTSSGTERNTMRSARTR